MTLQRVIAMLKGYKLNSFLLLDVAVNAGY